MNRIVAAVVGASCLLGTSTWGSCDPTGDYAVPLGSYWHIRPDPDGGFILGGSAVSWNMGLTGVVELWAGRQIVAGRTRDAYFVLFPSYELLFGEDGRLKKDPAPVLGKLELFEEREAWERRLSEMDCTDVVLRAPRRWDSPAVRFVVYAAIGGACAAAPLSVLLGAGAARMYYEWRARRNASAREAG